MQRLTFPKRSRLSKDQEYRRALRDGCRKPRGPLTIHVHANDLDFPRLGLSIGRRCGGAVVRHRLKRLLREAFRLSQHDLPAGYDVVVTARKHARLPLSQYQALLQAGMEAAVRDWCKREARRTVDGDESAPA